MAQLLTVRLSKSDHQPLGFRLQGGKDFGTPLVVQKVNGGSAAEHAGLQAGDALIRVNSTEVYALRHQEAQDAIRASGSTLELTVQRGGGTWRPSVTPTGSLPRPGSRPLGASPVPVTNTSLRATPQPSRAFGSGHNSVAKPFGYMNGNESVKSVVNKQYNSPVNMYSDKTIAETLSAQTEVLAGGVLGVNFKKNEKCYDAEKSAVFKVLQEEQNDPEPEMGSPAAATPAVSGLRHVQAPVTRPDAPINNTGGLPPGQNICEECERLITGVFVRIKDKNLHVECFKCSTCGSSLKNQGYYNISGKLYCDIHAKLVARQNPPAAHLEPVTVPPGGRIPTNTYSTPLPPIATSNYTNGSSSLFSPSSNLSGPKPFGSSIGSAYSPSLSPRSAPLSPARPVTAPAPTLAAVTAPAGPPPMMTPTLAPFAPINEAAIHSTPNKHEYKSPAEERLIRKMAKMALNGYEIGIQRKIKPADHIQSMADKIQDTVVTKHPLNVDNLSSADNSRENTLKFSRKSADRGNKTTINIQNLGDNIKDIVTNNHPATNNNLDNRIPPPPPPPTLTYNMENMPKLQSNKVYSSKPIDTDVKGFNSNTNKLNTNCNDNLISQTIGIKNHYSLDKTDMNSDSLKRNLQIEHTLNGINKITQEKQKLESNFDNHSLNSNTLNKKDISEKNLCGKDESFHTLNEKNNTEYLHNTLGKKKFTKKTDDFDDSFENLNAKNNCENNNYSNTLSKKNIFEKRNELNNTACYNGNVSKDNKNISDLNATKKSIFDKSPVYQNILTNAVKSNEEKSLVNDQLPNNVDDNTLYTYKPIKLNDVNESETVSQCKDKLHDETASNLSQDSHENDGVVVKRREKKTDRNSDGRRDSHIITRPLSTMTVDVADGVYPVCHKCARAITRGPFITALGRIWCPEHFICVNATCRRPLQDIGFVEENGQLYCEFCFEQYIAPACDKCHAKIKGDCLNAIGKHFHPECFNCVYCGKLFGNNPFFLEDGLPYCEADWNELFTTKCFACGFPVEAGDRWVEALNNNYHSQCFNCTVCKRNLEGQSFFAKGGRPFCKSHAR